MRGSDSPSHRRSLVTWPLQAASRRSVSDAERLLRTIAVVGYLAGPLPLLRRECSTSRPTSILSCPLYDDYVFLLAMGCQSNPSSLRPQGGAAAPRRAYDLRCRQLDRIGRAFSSFPASCFSKSTNSVSYFGSVSAGHSVASTSTSTSLASISTSVWA